MRSISVYNKTDTGQETISLKFSIKGEVWFNGSFCLIIEPDLLSIKCDRHRAKAFQKNDYYVIFGQINIDSQNYLVVKFKDKLKSVVVSPQELLSARELQIVGLVAYGKSNKQIAAKLRISQWTVSTHLRRIFIKLDVDSRAEMVYHCASLVRYQR